DHHVDHVLDAVAVTRGRLDPVADGGHVLAHAGLLYGHEAVMPSGTGHPVGWGSGSASRGRPWRGGPPARDGILKFLAGVPHGCESRTGPGTRGPLLLQLVPEEAVIHGEHEGRLPGVGAGTVATFAVLVEPHVLVAHVHHLRGHLACLL